jgi:tetratricopeptide (TPR) repeat protein
MTTVGEIRDDKNDISRHDGLPAGRKVDGTDANAHQYLELASKYDSEEILDSGLQDLEFANSLSTLVALLERQGKYDEAIPLCKRSLTIRAFALGNEHSQVAQNLYQLGGLLWKDQKYNEAVPFYEQAFATKKLLQQGSEDPLEFAQSLSRLATMFERQGIYDDSITMRRRSLAIRKLALGEDHLEVAGTLNDLAELLQQKFDQVDKVRQKASLITWTMSPLYTGPRILTGTATLPSPPFLIE